jgi:acyl dehydratase
LKNIDIVDRSFSSFRVGECASFEKEFVVEEIERFAVLSGDWNDLHMEESFAATTRYKNRIAHGLLVAAPISTLAGHLLPGKHCLLLDVSSRFTSPVFPGDRLTYQGTIIRMSPATQVIKVEVEASNQDGTVVLRGTYQAQVLQNSSEGKKI